MMAQWLITDIKVGTRNRKNLGDIDALAESIDEVGLLHPIVVRPSGQLVAGHRRLEACRELGWANVPVTVATRLDDARLALFAERDENICRKDMIPSESVSLGRELAELERPLAAERMKAGVGPSGKLPEGSRRASSNQVREIVGAAVGMSGTTYERAKFVVAAAEREDLSPEDHEVAVAALAQMDATGKVTGAYNKVATILGKKQIGGGTRNSKPPTPKTYKGRSPLEGIRASIGTLVGLASGFGTTTAAQCAPDYLEAAEWDADLKESAYHINRFRRTLKEYRNGQE